MSRRNAAPGSRPDLWNRKPVLARLLEGSEPTPDGCLLARPNKLSLHGERHPVARIAWALFFGAPDAARLGRSTLVAAVCDSAPTWRCIEPSHLAIGVGRGPRRDSGRPHESGQVDPRLWRGVRWANAVELGIPLRRPNRDALLPVDLGCCEAALSDLDDTPYDHPIVEGWES